MTLNEVEIIRDWAMKSRPDQARILIGHNEMPCANGSARLQLFPHDLLEICDILSAHYKMKAYNEPRN